MRKTIIIFLVLCLCVCMLSVTAFAANTTQAQVGIDTSAKASLTLIYGHDGKVFKGREVELYRVASVSNDFQYTLTSDFADTMLVLNGVTAKSEWNTIRKTLESHIKSKKLLPDRLLETAADGSVKFSDLTPGMYFVMPVEFKVDRTNYSFDSALIAVPGLDENGLWVYDVVASPKPDVEHDPPLYKNYKVVKLWRDNGNGDKRPPTIEVEIFCNDVLKETVTLSADNKWSYSWTAANNGDKWHVMEKKVPEGYVMTMQGGSTYFTIVNTIPGTPELPATGDTSNIVFYVIMLCVSGFMLVFLAVVAKRKDRT